MTSTLSVPPNAEQRAAIRRIESFRQRFGDGHFYLACHAALPLALTPDLLYCLWVNFQQDSHQALLNIPWIAVSDLVLSNLCEEVGYELYEMDVATRNELLKQLQNDSRFGLKRVRELADFVMVYVEQQLDSSDLDARDFAEAQRWRALAYKNPAVATRELALALARLNLADKTEWIRMAELVMPLAEPLAEFSSLLTYVSAMKDLARGNKDSATTKFSQILDSTHSLQIAGVALLVPEGIEINQRRSRLNSESSKISRINYLQRYFLWFVTGCLTFGLVLAYFLQSNQLLVYFLQLTQPSPSPATTETPTSVPSISPTRQPTEIAKLASQTDTALRLRSIVPSADVAKLQQQLRTLGFDVAADGVFGSTTAQAIRSFQASNGLVVDGIPGPATRNALSSGKNAISPNPTLPTVNSSPSSARKRYVVVVPAKSSATLSQVQEIVPSAVYTSSNLGRYVWAGAFDEKGYADARAALLRANRLDAQVQYF